jgi:glycogen debranching enzyme
MIGNQPAAADAGRESHNGTEENNPYYIQASTPSADEHRLVLKQGDTFGVYDHYGDIRATGQGELGLYHEGTRYLSGLSLRLVNSPALFLSSTVKEENDLIAVDLTNPDVLVGDRIVIPHGALHIYRTIMLWYGVSYDSIRIKNYGTSRVDLPVTVTFEADYADIFEVRGTRRKERGRLLQPATNGNTTVLSYMGLDGAVRRTQIRFDPLPRALSDQRARFDLSLEPGRELTMAITVACARGRGPFTSVGHEQAAQASAARLQSIREAICHIDSSSEPFDAWVHRAVADLQMMTTDTGAGPYPYAGVPWFNTPFGRDGLLTALMCLWPAPDMAKGVLGYLAATQAQSIVPLQDAEPGKILHETRDGEMAALGEIPFGRYYGSVDATPLFVWLAGAYFERTTDLPFIQSIWPNLERAIEWIDHYGDRDGDSFVEYYRQSPTGLTQQGWKDSWDSVFHADGTLAEGPIALCEVQGYVFAAKRAAAALADALDRPEQATALRKQADLLRERFEQSFWLEDLGTYALALDGHKRPCRVRTSNPGHCLLTGIAHRTRAHRVARTLLAPESFSGWGVRTVASSEARYNPMSYHDGSVWPHDNALIAGGLARHGIKEGAIRILNSFFEASLFLDLHRLPELFCGFVRRPGEGPTLYPVACSPQSWSAAAVFMMLQACLGLTIEASRSLITFHYPQLPPFLKELHIRNLKISDATIDLQLLRHGHDVGINVPRRQGHVEIHMIK